jgi:hypothetical protein
MPIAIRLPGKECGAIDKTYQFNVKKCGMWVIENQRFM